MKQELKQRFKRYRAFLFAVIAVTVVWVFSAMSERKVYREHYRIVYDGVDTACYAMTRSDSVVILNLTSNGFHAFNRGISHNHTIHLDVGNLIVSDTHHNIQLTLQTEEYSEQIKNQLDNRGVSAMQPVTQALQVQLARRESKTLTPTIEDIQFQFDGTAGLCGEPTIIPSQVTLYGSRESLDKITSLKAAPRTISNLRTSGKHRVELEPTWKQYPDLRVSTSEIDIYVPVESFIERAFTIPVTLRDNNKYRGVNNVDYRLYPAVVTVKALVPRKDYSRFSASDFVVTAVSESDTDNYLHPTVSQFPVNVRVKSIAPSSVQYIIIK